MRDIKFRAWDADNSFMIDENYNDDDYLLTFDGLTPKLIGIKFDSHDYANVENSVIMQFTGLQDKNGVDIYEGDILRDEIGDIFFVVKFDDAGCFVAANHDDDCDSYFLEDFDFEVVGNIYENSDLLD